MAVLKLRSHLLRRLARSSLRSRSTWSQKKFRSENWCSRRILLSFLQSTSRLTSNNSKQWRKNLEVYWKSILALKVLLASVTSVLQSIFASSCWRSVQRKSCLTKKWKKKFLRCAHKSVLIRCLSIGPHSSIISNSTRTCLAHKHKMTQAKRVAVTRKKAKLKWAKGRKVKLLKSQAL